MKKFSIVFAAALCAGAAILFLTPTKTSGKTDKFRRSSRPIANQYIVVLNDETDEAPGAHGREIADRAREIAAQYHGAPDRLYAHALKGYSASMSESQALRLSEDPRVKYVEEDHIIETAATQSNATWGIARIDQRNFVNPLDTNYNYGASGKGVSVYVVDTGIRTTHVDFEGRASIAFDAFPGDPVGDCNGHGTHVAGTVGSRTYGVAKDAKLFSLRVFSCSGAGSGSGLLAAVDWITRNAARPAVTNLSLTSPISSSLESAIKSSISSGITYVAAAGNYSTDACSYSPARIADVITVGGSGMSDSLSTVTNFGPCVDLFAPGSGITSTSSVSDDASAGMGGTSAATPHVAGTAAIYLEVNPTASPREVSSYLLANATPNALYNVPNGTPNLLLYAYMDSSGTSSPSPSPTPLPSPSPEPAPMCDASLYSGSLAANAYDYQTSSAGFAGQSGKYSGTLTVPAGAQFRLELEKQKGKRWSVVARSSPSASTEIVNYSASSGMYRWRVSSVSGSGIYSLCSRTP